MSYVMLVLLTVQNKSYLVLRIGMLKKPNKHKIPAVTISYHFAKLKVSIFFEKVLILWLLRKICCSA